MTNVVDYHNMTLEWSITPLLITLIVTCIRFVHNIAHILVIHMIQCYNICINVYNHIYDI